MVNMTVGTTGDFLLDWQVLIEHYEKEIRGQNRRPLGIDECAWTTIVRGRAVESAVNKKRAIHSEVFLALMLRGASRRTLDDIQAAVADPPPC